MTSRASPKNRRLTDLGPVPEIISKIPHPYPASPQELGVLISNELTNVWESLLSKAELKLLQSQKMAPTAFEKLDALIVKQAQTMGWRLGLSQVVHWVFSEWDFQDNGPELFERYGEALATSALRFQKKRLPPLDDSTLPRFKKETVQELRQVLRHLRKAPSEKQGRLTSDRLINLFQVAVSREASKFRHLRANINSWKKFFRSQSPIKPVVTGNRVSPAALFDHWFAWSKGRDPETVRQRISELGRFIRDREHAKL